MSDEWGVRHNHRKCTSWLGHKFEARYSSSRRRALTFTEALYLLSAQRDDLIRSGTNKTYEGDVCVRCGCVVNTPTPNTEAS